MTRTKKTTLTAIATNQTKVAWSHGGGGNKKDPYVTDTVYIYSGV